MRMVKKLLFILIFLPTLVLSQENEQGILLSKAIDKNIKRFREKSQDAHAVKDFERADFLFDSLISNVIIGSTMDNFKVKKVSGRKIELNKFEKPIFLMTYASWCTPGVGEIPALNKVAEAYHKEIDFIVLFWDSKKKVKKVAKNYSKHINIVYVDESENTNDHIIQTMKHSLGFPTSFFVDSTKKIIDVRRGVLHPYNEDYAISYELNYDSFLNGITFLRTVDPKNTTTDLVTKE